MTYAQRYYARKRARELGISVEEYLRTRKKAQPILPIPQPEVVISFDKVQKLDKVEVNEKMLKVYKTGSLVDKMFSYEEGIPVGTNIMCTGDPGVGKTTVLLHTLATLQINNPKLKCFFVCAEMSKIQMYKYTQRFPIFGTLETIFTNDYHDSNMKSVIEQVFEKGYDYVMIDSIVEVIEAVKEDAGMTKNQAERWLVDLCVKHNKAQNKRKVYTTFLLVQQVTKAGVFVGTNKLKHITDAHMELKKGRDNDGSYLVFSKNRNGMANIPFSFQLGHNEINYGYLLTENVEGPEQFKLEITNPDQVELTEDDQRGL